MEILKVEFSTAQALNFAAINNGLPLINELFIENTADKDILAVDISVSSTQSIINSSTYHLDVLPKNLKIDVNTLKIEINQKYLLSLENIEDCEIVLKVLSEGKELYVQKNKIKLLPFDYWTGAEVYPELTAAFITPNSIDSKKVLHDAFVYLKKWTKSNNFIAYNGEANRVLLEAAAVFNGLSDQKIALNPIITDNRTLGLPIRLDNVLNSKTATIAEIAFLYASLLENIGLNPILAVFEKSFLVGAWLDDNTFADCINDDIAELSKKSALGEIFLIDPQCLDWDFGQDFDNAKMSAKSKLIDDNNFLFFIDIKRCRLSYVYPNPKRFFTQNGWDIEYEQIESTGKKPQRLNDNKVLNVDETLSKQKYWERKLLDLTLKNSLLNFKLTKNVLPVLGDSLKHLADSFCNGTEYDILPVMKEAENLILNYEITSGAKISESYHKLIGKELTQSKLRTALDENSLKSTITNIYRKYKYSIEENGVCTLYLALGLLKWYEDDISERPLYAPLVLIPLDLVRKNAKRYIIKARDDEPYFNITLLEMLKQQYSLETGGLDPLPRTTQNAIDVTAVFNTVRKLVMNQPRWDIIEESYISNFSFSGIVMWYDIRNRLQSFQKTPIVKGLMTGIPFNKTSLEIKDIDERWLNEEIILPIEADSSQLEAIYFASKNMSFVLHGPPGTGKSQTITNIIANGLLRGQRILFVAEKMAALSVVKNRLEEIGIGDFCLELHSDKTDKKAVLENLRKTSEITKVYEPEDFKATKERLENTRKTLASYMFKLHRQQKFGFSLSQAISQYLSYDFFDQFEFPKELIADFDKEKIEFVESRLQELMALGKDMGHPYGSVLEHIGQTEYSQTLKIKSTAVLKKFLADLSSLRGYTETFSTALDLNRIDTYQKFEDFMQICSYLSQSRIEFGSLEKLSNNDLNKLISFSELGLKNQGLKNELEKRYDVSAFKPVSTKLALEYRAAKGLKRFAKKNAILKVLKKAAKAGTKYKENFLADIEQVIIYQQNESTLEKGKDFLNSSVLELTQKDYLYIHDSLTKYMAYRECMSRMAFSSEDKQKLHTVILPKTLQADYESFRATKDELNKLLIIAFEKIHNHKEWYLETLTNKAVMWSMDELKERCAYNTLREELNGLGLGFVTNAYDNGLDHDMLIPAFKKALLKAVIEYIVVNDDELNKFTGRLFEEKIRRFKELEQKYRTVSRQLLSARLKMNLPNFDIKSSQMSELGIFQRAVKGTGRNLTIKKLFEQIPNILPKVAPCMLMSPVTVAQYIDPQEPFDLLIFDEASQLTTAKAVGALSRAKAAIIVGDPKQLPPTSFFENINTNVNEEESLSEDLESVLDDCLALNMPEIHLKWHYRSKDESLIAFSNRSFYDNSLYTFPSPTEAHSCIKFVKVNGVYDRGKSKQNVEEALAVTEEVIKRLSDPELRKKSIGIVTFSIMQQNLIDDMLTETFRQSPKLEQYAMQRTEPLFVKNLENVQGDERDVILFSVGYGQDAHGKLSLNFGPLNRDGGWRRLNVAVSRAKYEMIIFSSITYDMINLSATTAQGVKALRGFLEYAQKGKGALVQKASSLEIEEHGIEDQIVRDLKEKGYDGIANYGTSGYKINIAVVHPDDKKKFILGIMCDGLGYSKVKTVKEREVSPFNVLKKLGWNLMRVWSLDYFDSPEKIVKKIIQKIEDLRKNSDGIIADDDEVIEEINTEEQKAITITNPLEAEYKKAVIPTKIIPSSYFSTEYNQPHLIKITKMIIDTEYPVSYNTILRAVLESSGITRSGARIEAQMKHVLEHIKCDCELEGDKVFYWKKNADKKKYNIYRVGSTRTMDDISIYEIINAIRYIIQNQVSLPKAALEQEVIKLFGSKHTEEGCRQIRRAIKYGLDNKIITAEDDRILEGENLKKFDF